MVCQHCLYLCPNKVNILGFNNKMLRTSYRAVPKYSDKFLFPHFFHLATIHLNYFHLLVKMFLLYTLLDVLSHSLNTLLYLLSQSQNILLVSERSERDTLRSVKSRFAIYMYIYIIVHTYVIFAL